MFLVQRQQLSSILMFSNKIGSTSFPFFFNASCISMITGKTEVCVFVFMQMCCIPSDVETAITYESDPSNPACSYYLLFQVC